MVAILYCDLYFNRLYVTCFLHTKTYPNTSAQPPDQRGSDNRGYTVLFSLIMLAHLWSRVECYILETAKTATAVNYKNENKLATNNCKRLYPKHRPADKKYTWVSWP